MTDSKGINRVSTETARPETARPKSIFESSHKQRRTFGIFEVRGAPCHLLSKFKRRRSLMSVYFSSGGRDANKRNHRSQMRHSLL